MGYLNYLKLVGCLTDGVKDEADILWFENQIWYEDLGSDWDFFIQKTILFQRKMIVNLDLEELKGETEVVLLPEEIRDAINYFLYKEGEYVLLFEKTEENTPLFIFYNALKDENGQYSCSENNFKFTEVFYNALKDYLFKLNWIDTKEAYEFTQGGNKRAKIFLLKQNYKKRKKKNKEDTNLSSIISALVAKGISYSEIWNFSIYFVYDIYYRLCKIENYTTTMRAYAAGNIDTKKNPIKWSEIDWASKI